MPSRPFDLAKMDYETVRRQKRRKLLVWSIIPVIVLLAAALWFLLPSLLTHQAIGAYKRHNYPTARRWLTPLTWTSPEQFVIAFNSGTVDTQLGHYNGAEVELTRALALAPPARVCMVAQNLVYSLEAHANSLKGTMPNDAIIYYTKALNTIRAHAPCFKGSAAQGRIGGEKQKAQGQAASSSQSQQGGQTPTAIQQQQLQQKEDQGQQRQQQSLLNKTFDPNDPYVKQW